MKILFRIAPGNSSTPMFTGYFWITYMLRNLDFFKKSAIPGLYSGRGRSIEIFEIGKEIQLLYKTTALRRSSGMMIVYI